MIQASVNIQKPLHKWYQPNLGCTSAEVTIGKKHFHLSRIRKLGSSSLFFELRSSQEVIKIWELKYKWNGTASMQIAEGEVHPILYTQGFFGRSHFITQSEKIPALLEHSGNARTFQLLGMRFQHHDFQPSITVSSPNDKIYIAILIADLIYNFPYDYNNAGGG